MEFLVGIFIRVWIVFGFYHRAFFLFLIVVNILSHVINGTIGRYWLYLVISIFGFSMDFSIGTVVLCAFINGL